MNLEKYLQRNKYDLKELREGVTQASLQLVYKMAVVNKFTSVEIKTGVVDWSAETRDLSSEIKTGYIKFGPCKLKRSEF